MGGPQMDWRLAWTILLGWLLWGSSASAESPTLPEALESLRAEGIETIYTSRLVSGDSKVVVFPPPGPAKERLQTLLSPFGLTARPTSDGRWLVVVQSAAVVEGCLVSDPGGQPIPGASLHLEASGGEVAATSTTRRTRSSPSGCFHLSPVVPGEQRLEVSRPGYVSRRATLRVAAGAVHRADFALPIDARASDEISVATRPGDLPLGTWHLRSDRQASTRSDPDLLTALGEAPGTLSDSGVAFGVRGRDSERLTLVVDGITMVEPYHFRDLGNLAGAVTPDAVAEVHLHRGSPPLVHGNRAGGVLEMITTSAADRFSGRLGSTAESHQASFHGSVLGDRGRWLAAFREGRPTIPREIAEVDTLPLYLDGVAKISATLGKRQDLSLQALWARDDFSFRPDDDGYLLAVDNFSPVLAVEQRSYHVALRHLLSVGSRHIVETLITDVEIDRRRFGFESDGSPLKPEHPRIYHLDDHRITQRRAGRIEGSSKPSDRLDIVWGAESSREQTAYDATGPFELGPGDGFGRVFLGLWGPGRFIEELEEQHLAAFGQATWRPSAALTLKTGLRWDDSQLADESRLAPRVSVGFRRGKGLWRATWARAMSVPATHELPLADGETTLPGLETTDYSSLGYHRSWTFGHFSVEAHRQRIGDPRPRFVNLYKPISRVPELEIDRRRLEPDASRLEGIDVQVGAKGLRWRGGVTYQLGRAEDWIDGRWRPRPTDRRHRWNAWMALRLHGDLRAELRWYGSTGGPTTPFDLGSFDRTDDPIAGFEGAVGEYNSRRLPPEHQLDVRLTRQWRWRGLTVTAEAGIDNLYDRRHVRGFSLASLREEAVDDLDGLPPELGLGRRFRWGVALGW